MLAQKINTNSLWLLIFVCCSFLSCQDKKEKISVGYYNIDSLLTSQIYYLPTCKISLVKYAGLNGKIDSTLTLVTDTILWSKELEIFRQLNVINKPINSQAYKMETLSDAKSNLTIRAFIPLQKLPVKYFKIYYQGSLANIKKIEALYHEENLLYRNSRKLLMEFEKIYNKITLVNYAIEGDQKMFLGDSVKFFLKGKVVSN